MKTPITLGVDPAAPNGGYSAMVVAQGNRNPCMEIDMPNSDPRYTYYLLRKLEVVASDAGNHDLPAFLHTQGQHGDVLVTQSYMGKFRAYFWAGKKKHYWRRVDSRKYPDLMPQLRAALLLQS